MRFLVVDDSSTMRRIIVNALHKLGYADCAEAANGRQGIEQLAADPVDVIFTDWNMPEMDGLAFVRAVRSNAKTKHLPVLMVTTNASEEKVVEALRAGVTNYLIKPFTTEAIREKIDGVMGV